MDATQEWGSEACSNGAVGTAAVGLAERRRGRRPSQGPAKVIGANKSNNKFKSRDTISGPSASRKVILSESRQEKSVRYCVQSQYQLAARALHGNDGNRHQWHCNNFIQSIIRDCQSSHA